MAVRLSPLVEGIQASVTLEMGEKAYRMKREGQDVVSFAQGEPDFDTPEAIKRAAVEALRDGFTKYTPSSGIAELKEAICTKLQRDNGLRYSPAEIIVSTGAKQVLYNVIATLCGPGDEVILLTPCWVTYVEQVKMVGARPVFVLTREEDGFIPSVEAVTEKISPRTKAILLNTPNNPTGAIYTEETLRGIASLTIKNRVFIIADEVYEKLIYDGEKHLSIAALDPAFKEHTIIVNGWSKAYAMTGWRLGFAAGPSDIIKGMGKLQGHITGNPNSIAQKAGAFALLNNSDYEKMVPEYSERRKYMVQRLNAVDGIHCLLPKGAFYAFPNVTGLYGRRIRNLVIKSDMDVARFLLEEALVATVAGEAFESAGYIRLSYATSMQNIEKALDRIEAAVAKLC